MAEGRMLKRKITLSKKFVRLKSDKARLLWLYMLPFTDVDGRLEADAEDIRDEILRKQRKGYSVQKIEECLQDLHRVGLIILYSANSKRYLQFTRFSEEQKLRRDKEAKTTIPAPTTGEVREQDGTTPSCPPKVKRSKVKLSKVKLSKEKYKDFILLTDEEHKKLLQRYGENNTRKLIDSLNRYIGSTGKEYKSHYFTLLNFAKRDDMPELKPPKEDAQAEQQAREKKRQEIRDLEKDYYIGKTTNELKELLKDKKLIPRHWLITEILKERK